MKIVVKKYECITPGKRYIRELFHDGTYAWFGHDEEDAFPIEPRRAKTLEAKFRAAWSMTLKDTGTKVTSNLTGFKAKLLEDAYYAILYAEDDLLEKYRLKDIDPDEQATIPSDSFTVKVDSISHCLSLNGHNCTDYDKI